MQSIQSVPCSAGFPMSFWNQGHSQVHCLSRAGVFPANTGANFSACRRMHPKTPYRIPDSARRPKGCSSPSGREHELAAVGPEMCIVLFIRTSARFPDMWPSVRHIRESRGRTGVIVRVTPGPNRLGAEDGSDFAQKPRHFRDHQPCHIDPTGDMTP